MKLNTCTKYSGIVNFLTSNRAFYPGTSMHFRTMIIPATVFWELIFWSNVIVQIPLYVKIYKFSAKVLQFWTMVRPRLPLIFKYNL